MRARARRASDPGSSETINLRASPAQKMLIDRAASLKGKSRTEFMLESACAEAENTLLDRRLFLLDDDHYTAFLERLDAPVEPGDALRRLLATPAPWEH